VDDQEIKAPGELPANKLNMLSEAERAEYQEANIWWRTLSDMRRRDIALITASQGAILAIIKEQVIGFKFDLFSYAFGGLAVAIALLGVLNERRLYSYLRFFRARGIQIEKAHGMRLMTDATEGTVAATPWKSSPLFQAYYWLLACLWTVLLLINAARAVIR